jgi:hypothetical protein
MEGNMNDILMIMNPRNIKDVIDSIRAIDIPKAWFTGFTEIELEGVMNDFVKSTNYDNYILTSDDLIINPNSLKNIRNNARKYDVLTGYCNLYLGSKEVNLCLSPLTLSNGEFPRESDYNFCTIDDVSAQKSEIFKTYLSGFSLTLIKRDIWLDIPFQAYHRRQKGESSDHNFSYRTYQKGIEMYSHKDSFSTHIKSKRNSPLKSEWIVGKEKPKVVFEK